MRLVSAGSSLLALQCDADARHRAGPEPLESRSAGSRTDCFVPLSPALKLGDSYQETSTNAYHAQIGQNVPFEMIATDSKSKSCLIDGQRDAVNGARRLSAREGRFPARDAHREGSSMKAQATATGLALEPSLSAVPLIHSCLARVATRFQGSGTTRRLIEAAYPECDQPADDSARHARVVRRAPV